MFCAQVIENLLLPGRPSNLYALDGLRRAEPKVNSRRALPAESVSAVNEAQVLLAAGRHPHLSPYGHPIRFCSLEQELHPLIRAGLGVPVEERLRVGVGHEQIHTSIIVEIRHRHTASIPNRIESMS